VANEIKELANQSAKATKETALGVNNVRSEAENLTRIAGQLQTIMQKFKLAS